MQAAGFIVALRTKGETVEELAALVRTMHRYPSTSTSPPARSTRAARAATGRAPSTCRRWPRSSPRAPAHASSSTATAPRRRSAARPTCSRRSASRSSSARGRRALRRRGRHRFLPRAPLPPRDAFPRACTRKELGVPTTFNFLGPLANPAHVKRQAVGVSDETMATRMLGALRLLGTEQAMVFHGDDGLDELTTSTTSTMHELVDGRVRTYHARSARSRHPRADAARRRGRRGDQRGLLRAVLAASRVRTVTSPSSTRPPRSMVAGLAARHRDGPRSRGPTIDDRRAADRALDTLVRVSTAERRPTGEA